MLMALIKNSTILLMALMVLCTTLPSCHAVSTQGIVIMFMNESNSVFLLSLSEIHIFAVLRFAQ